MRFMTISVTDQACLVQLGEYYLSIRYYMTCLCRQIGLVWDRYIEDLHFWADKFVIYKQIIMLYYYLTEWPVIIDFINLATRPII